MKQEFPSFTVENHDANLKEVSLKKNMVDKQHEIVGRIQSLRDNEGKTGIEIAQILYTERCELKDVLNAFLEEGYVASAEVSGVTYLHVSDLPIRAPKVAKMVSSEPRSLPQFIWR